MLHSEYDQEYDHLYATLFGDHFLRVYNTKLKKILLSWLRQASVFNGPSKCIDEGEEEAKMMDLRFTQIIVFRVSWKLHGGSGDVAEIVVGNALTTTATYNYYSISFDIK